MVATIAPGPASSGVPSGTSATLTFSVSVGLVGLAGEQLEGDEQQQQAAGALHRRQRDAQVVEDRLAEQREHGDDEERDEHRLPRQPLAHAAWLRPLVSARNSGMVPGGSMITNSVTKTSPKNLHVRRSVTVPRAHAATPLPWPGSTSASSTSGAVVFSPSRLGLPVPW